MLTTIIFSIMFLPGIIFLIVCLLGFHGALVAQRSIRTQVEHLEGNEPADDSQVLNAHRKAA